MMRINCLVLALATCAIACSASTAEDERQNTGPGSPAAIYCTKQGYTARLSDNTCVFPGGASCEQFAFYRGECGQPFSFCVKRGGVVSSETRSAAGATFIEAYCTLGGVKCKEQEFLSSGLCK